MVLDIVNEVRKQLLAAQASYVCDVGWIRPDQSSTSCYKKVPVESGGGYGDAIDVCSSEGAQLVTIESDKENKFVATFISTLFEVGYIGLTKDGGVWKWLTGDIPVFLNWSNGQPDERYKCAYLMKSGHWFSKPCEKVNRITPNAICEKYFYGTPTTTSNQLINLGTSESVQYTDLSTGSELYADVENPTTIPGELSQGITNTNLALTVAVPSVVGLIILVMVLVIAVRRTKKHRSQMKAKTSTKDKLELSDILLDMLDEDKKWKLKKLLVHRDKVEIEEEQGQGAFGIIYKGHYKPEATPLKIQIVAIKTLKEQCIGSEIVALVEEALIMAEFNHIHVMSIIGVCIRREDGVPMIMMPYMDNGDLNTYLRSFIFVDEKPTEKQLLLFCLQIARGMEYLAAQKCVHRDLAARNCMLDQDLLAKVADFGLTRDIYTSSYYKQDQQKLLPIKWMALESLQYRRFSCETDIWSYGVTMWEVMSLGMVPYPDLDNACVHGHVRSGTRLEKPDNCPDQMYTVMLNCWMENPAERPTFPHICQLISDYLASMCDYMDMDEVYGSNLMEKESNDIRYSERLTTNAMATKDSKASGLKQNKIELSGIDM